MLTYIVLIVLSCSNVSNAEWKLIWQDEFNSKELDNNTWSVTDGKDILEAPDSEKILSYSVNNENNIQLINGVLAISAIQQNYHDRNFTSASINSKKSIRYGRVDLRIAFPKGEGLKSVILLLPENSHYGEGRANGEIEIVADLQFAARFSRLSHHGLNFGVDQSYPATDGFQEYSLVWNATHITFMYFNQVKRIYDINRKLNSYYNASGQPFDQKFYLAMRLLVFKRIDNKVNITRSFQNDWECPTLIVDYVRVYQQDEFIDNETIKMNYQWYPGNSSDVCGMTKNKLMKFYVYPDKNSSNSDLIIGLFTGLVLVLMCLVVVIIILVKKSSRNSIEHIEKEFYDDVDLGKNGDIYDEVENNYNEYSNSYVEAPGGNQYYEIDVHGHDAYVELQAARRYYGADEKSEIGEYLDINNYE